MGFFIVCLVIGVVVGLVTVLIMKSQLNSVHNSESAHNYVAAGSLVLSRSTERFLYENVTRTPKPKNDKK